MSEKPESGGVGNGGVGDAESMTAESMTAESMTAESETAATGPAAPPLWRSIGAFVFWTVLHTLSMFPANPFAMQRGEPLQPIMPPVVGLVFNLALAAAFVWWFALRGDAEAPYRRRTFRLNAPPRAAVVRLPAIGVALVVAVYASLIVVPRFIPIPDDRGDPLAAYLQLPYGIVTVLTLAAVLVPLLEEFLFRGWIQSRVEAKLSPAIAIVFTAVLFGIVHFQLFGLGVRLIFGLTAGYLAWATRSIWPGVILHGIYNGMLLGGGTAAPWLDETVLLRWARTPSIFWPAAGSVLSLLPRARRAARRSPPTARESSRRSTASHRLVVAFRTPQPKGERIISMRGILTCAAATPCKQFRPHRKDDC